MKNYDKADGDIAGPFALGLAIDKALENGLETKIVWFSSGALLDETANTQVSGGNLNLFVNALNFMCEQVNNISIRSKSLDAERLTIPSGTVSLLSVLMVGLIPLAYLGVGIVQAVRRKRK